ncbi:Uncharacterised protein [Mycobacteroides abscessus]|nr:Uncharacterised protein [Mycobacteroides abscessus]
MRLGHARRQFEHAVVCNACREPGLESSGPGSQISAHTHPQQRDSGGVDSGQAEGEIQHRGDHGLPVVTERDLVGTQRGALPRPFKNQAVPAVPTRRLPHREVHLLDGRIESAVREQGRPAIVPACVEVIALQLDSFIGNLDPLPPRLYFRRTAERLDGARRSVQHTGVIARIVAQKELGRSVVVGRTQIGGAGAHRVPGRRTFRRYRRDPVGQRAPLDVPRLPIARRDPLRSGDNLADIGPAVGRVADRPQCLERERLVGLEDESHATPLLSQRIVAIS